ANNTTANAPASFTLTATATDSDGTITSVEFYNGTTRLGVGTANGSTYTFTWANVAAGTYTITAVATDNNGAKTTSAAIQLTVKALDCAGVAGGTAYIDNCGVCVAGTTGKTPCPQIKAQAEDISCDFSGIIESTNVGFEGTGYVNVNNAAGTSVTFTIRAITSGTYKLGFQYANGGSADRTCKILVNGVEVIAIFSMPQTTAWTNYQKVETTVTLKTGINKITLVALINDGLANLDYYYLYGNAQFTACETIQTIALQKGWNLISTNVYPTDSSISTLFKGLDVDVVKTLDAFWKNGQQPFLNTLQTIKAGEGYLVNMNVASTLTVTGNPVKTQNFASLPTGWQLIGCPFKSSTPFSNYFNPTNCQQIKNFDGFWIPGGSMNSIQGFEPGKGYYVLRK
ncbi:MAG: Ig-like domain-containing protein, partial [Bacteroidales bacterium]